MTGRGRYTDDHRLPNQATGHFVRSDRAHAKIVTIDLAAARVAKGVVGILTGEDVVAAGLKGLSAVNFFKGVGGMSLRVPFRPALAYQRVRYVGEPIVLVVGETEYEAQAAAELVQIDYEDLPVLVDARSALSQKAFRLHDGFPDNKALDYEYGDLQTTNGAFARAALVVREELSAERIAGNPMEPKSCLASYDAMTGIFDVYLPSQGTSDLRASLAQITGLDRARFQLHSLDVGGAFGVRHEIYPEYVAIVEATRRFGRPVKWTGTRLETISGDHHGRAAAMTGELALDNHGCFLGLRVEWIVNMGAYCSSAGALINTVASPTTMASSIYNVPAIYGLNHLVFTNTTPTTAYRGAARPNVAYLWERLVDNASRITGIDRIELRRRNLLKKEQFPHRTPTGSLYDSADPSGLLDCALEASEWRSFEKRRRQSQKSGKLRGIGCATFLEPSGGGGKEEIRIEITSNGRLALFANAGPSGQGHETVFPALVAATLGISEDQIELRYNDIRSPVLLGTGSVGSRSLISHGSALSLGAIEILRKAKELAAAELETDTADLTYADGVFCIAGTDVAITLKAIVDKFKSAKEHPLDTQLAIDTAACFPSGAHVAEVEIDPETGEVDVLNYVAVDDCGTIYNHVLVEGQLHGGLIQGMGQVLGEHIVYERDTGQLLSATFMDYFMPRAQILPSISLIDRPVPSPANSLGAKGAGEAGATGSVPALANAIIHALSPLGIHHVDLPLSPARIWQAIQSARLGTKPDQDSPQQPGADISTSRQSAS